MGELYFTTPVMFRLAERFPQPVLRTLFISSLQYHSCPQALHALTAFGVALPYPSVPTGNSWAWGIQGYWELNPMQLLKETLDSPNGVLHLTTVWLPHLVCPVVPGLSSFLEMLIEIHLEPHA